MIDLGATLVLRDVAAEGNSADIEGGFLYATLASASIVDVTIARNTANNGGALFADESQIFVGNASFVENYASGAGAAVAVQSISASIPSVINATDVVFEGNEASGRGGGVAFVTGPSSLFASLGNCTYYLNEATRGDGAVAYLNDHSEIDLHPSDIGRGNSAPLGGGGVFWYDHWTTNRPAEPPKSVVGSARYGDTMATGIASIRVLRDKDTEEANRALFNSNVTVIAFDAEKSTYKSGDVTVVELAAVEDGAELLGETRLDLDQSGHAFTSEIRVDYEPNRNVTIMATVELGDDLQVNGTTIVMLRDCRIGEIDRDGECVVCADSGQYSLDVNDEECQDCPSHASCDSSKAEIKEFAGAYLVLRKGHWRSSEISANIRTCKYKEACAGGVDLLVETNTDNCDSKHRGPLCALCHSNYILNRYSGKCHRCRQDRVSFAVSLILLVLVIILVPAVVIFVLQFDHPSLYTDVMKSMQTSSSFRDSGRSTKSRMLQMSSFIRRLMPLLKILFVFWQTVGSEYTTFLFVPYPRSFSRVATNLGITLNLGLYSLFANACVRVTHYKELLCVTLVPLGIVALCEFFYVVGVSRASTENSRKRIRNYTVFVSLLTLFVVYTSASLTIFSTFRCDDQFKASDKEPTSSKYHKKKFLEADYSIDCTASLYRAFVAYATLMIFIYPIGIPVIFFLLLWYKRRVINPDPQYLSNAILGRGIQSTISFSSDKADDDFDAGKDDLETHGSIGRSRNLPDGTSMLEEEASDTHIFSIAETAYVYKNCVAQFHANPALKNRWLKPGLKRMGKDLVGAHARVDRKAGHFAFLYQDYRIELWYFEAVECVRRLLLTSVLPSTFSVDQHLGLLYTTFLVSILFFAIYWWASPFADEGVNRFAVMMHGILSLILFFTIVLYVEDNLERDDAARWNSQAIGAVLVLLSVVLGPLSAVFYARLGGVEIHHPWRLIASRFGWLVPKKADENKKPRRPGNVEEDDHSEEGDSYTCNPGSSGQLDKQASVESGIELAIDDASADEKGTGLHTSYVVGEGPLLTPSEAEASVHRRNGEI